MALVTGNIEPAETAEALSDSRSDVIRVRGVSGADYAVKLYPDGLASNLEPLAYRLLAGTAGLRRRFASGDDFLITEYRRGRILAEATHDDDLNAGSVAGQIMSFVRSCARIRVEGFGEPDAALRGSASSWPGYLAGYFDGIARRLAALPDEVQAALKPAHRALHDHLAAHTESLEAVRPVLVPVDLNLANFLMTDDDQVVVLDLKTFWLADPLLALGEWTAHTYGTPLHGAVVKAWGALTAEEVRRVRFYALLATVDIELFIAEASGADPRDAVPWGNAVPFGRLGEAHLAELSAAEPFPEGLQSAVPAIRACWSNKSQDGTAHREPLTRTLERLDGVRALAGITRVADVTGLDRTGISVCQSVRPDAEVSPDTFTVFSGRGATPEQSRVASIAEAIERHCGERGQFPPERIRTGTAADLAQRSRVIAPDRFNLPADADYGAHTALEWVPATDLRTGTDWLVPACAVFFPYAPPDGLAAPFRYFTTGFGAGSTVLDAVAHGLAEVAERDAAALNRIVRANPAVDLDSIDSPVARAEIDRLLAADLNVIVRSITAPDLDVPAFSVICDDDMTRDSMYISGGYGAHPDKEIALIRAVQEAAASRAGTISGAREDLTKFASRGAEYAAFRRRYAYWFDVRDTVDYRSLPGRRLPTVLDDLTCLLRAFDRAGFPRALFVDLSRAELGLQVVKVLVPGVERYSFRMRCVGDRARRMYRERYGKELPLPPLMSEVTAG